MLSDATKSPTVISMEMEIECGARQIWWEKVEKAFPLTEYGKTEGDPAAYTITVEAPLRPFPVVVFSNNKLSLIASRTFSDGGAEAGREEDALKDILKKSPIWSPIIPQWDLGMVLKALYGALFSHCSL